MTEEQKKSSNFVVDYKNLMKSIEVIAKNKQGFGYNYADLNAVYEEVKPKIMENNFVLIQTVQRGDGIMRRRDTAVPVSKDKDGNILLSGAVDWEIPVYNLPIFVYHHEISFVQHPIKSQSEENSKYNPADGDGGSIL